MPCYVVGVARRDHGGGESLTQQLAASRREVARLRDENADLKLVIVEMQKALDASNADVARYRALHDASVSNRPERVPSDAQAAALEDVLRELDAVLVQAPAANDSGEGHDEEEPAPPASDPPARKRDKHGRGRVDRASLPTRTVLVDPPEVVAADGVGFVLVGSEVGVPRTTS